MKKNEKMQSKNRTNKVTNRCNNKVCDRQSCDVTDSKKNVGFVSDSDSFELDHNSENSFELKDCR